jgi:hypothetical protein
MMFSAQPANLDRFPSELDDREWLAARCRKLGDQTIAAELGVSRKVIRRACDRFHISRPAQKSSSNGSGKHPTTSSNRSSNPSGSGTSRSPKPTNGKPKGRSLASDQELAKRAFHVKKGLEVVVATLVRLANDMAWVGDQVQPQTIRPASAPAQRKRG